jgi:hypothetical protein
MEIVEDIRNFVHNNNYRHFGFFIKQVNNRWLFSERINLVEKSRMCVYFVIHEYNTHLFSKLPNYDLLNQKYGDHLNNDMNNLNLTEWEFLTTPKFRLNKDSFFFIYQEDVETEHNYNVFMMLQRKQKIAKINLLLNNI